MTRNEAKDRVVEAARELLERHAASGYGAISHFRALSDALALYDATPDSEGGWRPIETAPKDGTEILGFADRSWWVAWWSAENSRWEAGSVYFATELTHWQPLPAPPSQEQKPQSTNMI